VAESQTASQELSISLRFPPPPPPVPSANTPSLWTFAGFTEKINAVFRSKAESKAKENWSVVNCSSLRPRGLKILLGSLSYKMALTYIADSL